VKQIPAGSLDEPENLGGVGEFRRSAVREEEGHRATVKPAQH
jgi:hypothetical protein